MKTKMKRAKVTKKQENSGLDERDGGGKKIDKNRQIFGVPITGTHMRGVITKIGVQRKNLLHVATVNSEFLMEARVNPKFKEILSQCQLTVADSWGVVWAFQILGNGVIDQGKPVERISGVSLVEEILRMANERGEKVFLLGAEIGIAEKAAIKMAESYPRVEYGWYEGAKTVQVEKGEEASMTIVKINAFEPDYLLVAYGSPWQDIWIEENRAYLRTRVAIGIGGVLDEWAGKTKKCPEWLDRIGGKWLFRLIQEPWRWRRIRRVIQFGLLVVLSKLGVIRDISE